MTQEEKQILLQDLCARLPYGVKVCYQWNSYDFLGIDKGRVFINIARIGEWLPTVHTFDAVKPYLRPMSSMTDEEKIFYEYHKEGYCFAEWAATLVDWLNAHHFDYRNLIGRGLAIEAPEEMYKTE